ncbi:MAG TPA: large conductance mechanosensitive channel protein MscL [Vicinamibacteria bacterium]|nr:large conductance mechanosensitive channel protein MscL [Vicinamibacteria bacterium]
MLKEFKEFAAKGNVLDMAVGVIVGAAFATIVSSFVADILMPPIGLVVGNVDFSDLFLVLKRGANAGPYLTLAQAREAGAVTLNYGAFLSKVLSFLIVAFSVFLVVRGFNRLKKQDAAAAPPPPSPEVTLLTEIRDSLKARG